MASYETRMMDTLMHEVLPHHHTFSNSSVWGQWLPNARIRPGKKVRLARLRKHHNRICFLNTGIDHTQVRPTKVLKPQE